MKEFVVGLAIENNKRLYFLNFIGFTLKNFLQNEL